MANLVLLFLTLLAALDDADGMALGTYDCPSRGGDLTFTVTGPNTYEFMRAGRETGSYLRSGDQVTFTHGILAGGVFNAGGRGTYLPDDGGGRPELILTDDDGTICEGSPR